LKQRLKEYEDKIEEAEARKHQGVEEEEEEGNQEEEEDVEEQHP